MEEITESANKVITSKPPRRLPPHLFKPGQSGNPSGRPRDELGLRALCKAHTLDAVRTLHEIMMNEDHAPAARVTAACVLLDRGYGRPLQMTEISGRDGGPVEIVDTLEVARRLAFIFAQVEQVPEHAAN